MSRELSIVHLPDAMVYEAQVAVHKTAEGFTPSLASVRALAGIMLDGMFSADAGERVGYKYDGDFKTHPKEFTYDHKVNVCSATSFPTEIIDAALQSLDEDYGGLYGNFVIDAASSTRTHAGTMEAMAAIRSARNQESVIFVNWNEAAQNPAIRFRRQKIAETLGRLSADSPAHVMVVPSNLPANVIQPAEKRLQIARSRLQLAA